MIRLRRVRTRIPFYRRYEVEIDGTLYRTGQPVRILEYHVGIGDAWSFVEAADRRWADGSVAWAVEYDPPSAPPEADLDSARPAPNTRPAPNSFRRKDGERVLKGMLEAANLDPEQPRTVRETWAVFRQFVERPSDGHGDDEDGVLYQSGTFGFSGEDEFSVSFLRQFGFADRHGEHDHYEQLECEFRYPMTEQTRAFEQFSRWWFPDGDEPWADFVEAIERQPEFQALADATPSAASVSQERV